MEKIFKMNKTQVSCLFEELLKPLKLLIAHLIDSVWNITHDFSHM